MVVVAALPRQSGSEGSSGAVVPGAGSWLPSVVAVAGLAVTVAGLVWAVPFAVLVGCVLSVASVLALWVALDLALLTSALGWVLAATVTGLGAALLGVDLLAAPWLLSLVFVAVGVVAVVTALRRPRRARSVVGPRWVGVAYAPAVLAAGIAVVQGATARTAASWAFIATDPVQHMVALKEVQVSGSLDYGVDPYPRGLHMLWALVSGPALPHGDAGALLTLDMRLVASGTWLAFALVLLAAAALTLRLGGLLGAGPVLTVVAATLAAGGLLACNPFVYAFGYMAAAPSLVAIVVMWALPLTAIELAGSPRRGRALLVVAGVAVALLAHLWQGLALVPLAALAAGVPVVAALRGRVPLRDMGWALVWSALVAVPVAALSLPPMLGVLHTVGIAQAGVGGMVEQAPRALVVLALASLTRIVPRLRTAGARAYVGTAAGLVLVVALMIRGSGRLDLEQYYPGKTVWFLTIVLVPLLALALVDALARLLVLASRLVDRLGPAARVGRATGVAALVAAAVGFILPVPAVTGLAAFDTVRYGDATDLSGLRYDVALDYGTRYLPARTVPIEVGVGPVLDLESTLMVSRLISFETGQPVDRGVPKFVCQDVRTVAGGGPAVVLTSLEPAQLEPLMQRGGCGDVRVVRRPGPVRNLVVPLDPASS